MAAARARRAGASLLSAAVRHRSSQSSSPQAGLVAKTSLTSPPWPEVKLPDPVEEAKYHAEVVQKVNGLIAAGRYGRLFAVVHFASKQWKITSEDLIMMDNVLEAECGDRIRMEKVLLVGADDFTLVGRPLLGKDLVRVEATVIEKTESWPKVNMRFWRRHNFQRKKSKGERGEDTSPSLLGVGGEESSTRTWGRSSLSVSPEPLRASPCPMCTLRRFSILSVFPKLPEQESNPSLSPKP
uniref:Large ribosomal subunit protein bL21m n=1 Tax=Zonotrichia albicollis TaxID=44394 RepID=A0A8D2MBS4_ZONAL